MKAILGIGLLLCGLILTSPGSVFSAEGKPEWQTTWEKTVAAAKKEGKLNFYVGRYGSEPLLNEFRKEFPEIKLVTVNGAGNTLGTRIISEMRAGNVLADLFSGGANTNYEILYEGKALDSIKSALILPEVLDESKWYEGRHRYTDPEQRHVLIYIATPSSSGFYYNTNLVNPKEFKSYWDLVTPRWKGKYVSQEPSGTGLGASMQFFYYHPDLGAEYIKKAIRRHAADLWPGQPPDYRLAGARKICALRRLPGHGAGEEPGITCRRARQRRLERGHSTHFRWRLDEPD